MSDNAEVYGCSGRKNLSDEPIVFGVSADPKPVHTIRYFHAKSAVTQPDANGSKGTYGFEMKGWMLGIGLQQLEVLVRKLANGDRQQP
jgi:hypothetical protein